MNRIDPTRRMRRLSPRATVISGAALGIIGGAAVFGAVTPSTSSPTPTVFKQASATRAIAPKAAAAPCAKGSKLEHGVCIVHVVHTVVVRAPDGGSNQSSGLAQSRPAGSRQASREGASAAKPAERAEPAERVEAAGGAEPGENAAEQSVEAAAHAKEAAAEAAAHAKEAAAPATADR